jgi:hypothetical protein
MVSKPKRRRRTERTVQTDSKFIDDSYDNGQGQQNLGISERITNKGDWNQARGVINQSKIR